MDGANPAIGSVPKRVCCSDCCLSFSRSCHKLRSAKARRVFEAETHNLHHQVNLVEGYLGQLDAVFKGRVKSETLDELAVMLSRIITVEAPVVDFRALSEEGGHSALSARFLDSWTNYPAYAVIFFDFVGESRIPRVSTHTPWFGVSGLVSPYVEVMGSRSAGEKLSGRSATPSVSEFLTQLSSLHARLVALADAIDAGARV